MITQSTESAEPSEVELSTQGAPKSPPPKLTVQAAEKGPVRRTQSEVLPNQAPIPRRGFNYFRTACTIYCIVTALAVLDRFTYNVNPRQSFPIVHGWAGCEKLKPFGENGTKMSSSCGGDYFCGAEDEFHKFNGEMPKKIGDHFCLKDGPWTVKLFDVLSRTSGRIIITTTSLMFLTMCHCSWNSLAGTERFARFLGNVKQARRQEE